jgi:hypothetical protein
MKLTHLGKIVDLDPRQAAIEVRIVRTLYRNAAGVRQTRLISLTGDRRFGTDAFQKAVDRLVAEEIITRTATNYEKGFLLKLTPWGGWLGESLETELAIRTDVPLQPEAC